MAKPAFPRITSDGSAVVVVADGDIIRGFGMWNVGSATVYLGTDDSVDNTGFPVPSGTPFNAPSLEGPVYAMSSSSLDLRLFNGNY